MRKEDKGTIIAQIAETVNLYNFKVLLKKQAIYVVHVSKKVSK